jgi:hypothetical protein
MILIRLRSIPSVPAPQNNNECITFDQAQRKRRDGRDKTGSGNQESKTGLIRVVAAEMVPFQGGIPANPYCTPDRMIDTCAEGEGP